MGNTETVANNSGQRVGKKQSRGMKGKKEGAFSQTECVPGWQGAILAAGSRRCQDDLRIPGKSTAPEGGEGMKPEWESRSDTEESK